MPAVRYPPARDMSPDRGHSLFELQDVTVSLSGRTIIDKLNWRLEAGQVAVILGPSGSGKSVFLSTLLGFIEPDSGEILRPGDSPRGLFGEVSVLFQEDALLDDRSVEDNLAIALLERADVRRGSFTRDISAAIDATLLDVSLDPAKVRRQLPAHLSGGMRRRVSLARALLRKPRVLLADEPTSGLDPQTAESIYELMARLIRERELSAVIITHDPRCAKLLGNPSYEFTPTAGELKAWDPQAIRPNGAQSASPELQEGSRGDPGVPEILGGLMDRLGESVLALQRLGSLPQPALLREGLVQWGLKSAGLIILIFLISGLVVQIQAERAVVDLGFSNRIPELFALALSRIAPLVVGVLLAGRCGSTVSAQTGWRVFSSQYRALITMRIDPDRTFLPVVCWSWIIAAPLLMALGVLAASAAALLFLASPLSEAQITPTYFLNVLPEYLTATTILTMTMKGVFMAGGAALIAYRCGSTPKLSSEEVMGGMTRALVLSFVWLALVDLFLSLILPA